MVKTYFWMPVLAAAAMLAGCAKEVAPVEKGLETPEATEVETEEISFDVTAPDMRTYMSGSTVRWNANDRVRVVDNTGYWSYSSKVAASGVSATLTASIIKGSAPLYALYPADENAAIADGKITTTLSSEQAPSNVGSFGKCNVAVGKFVSDGGDGYATEMKNVCGYLKITLPKHTSKTRKDDGKDYSSTHVSSVVISTTTGDLAGDITVDYNDGTPVITKVENGVKTITLNVKHYTEKDTEKDYYLSGDYYFVVLPGSYSGLSVTLKYDDGTPDYTRTSAGSFSVKRGQYTNLGILADDVVILDFTNGNDQLYQGDSPKTYLPTSAYHGADGVEDVWKLDNNGRTYNFGFLTWTTGNATYKGTYSYHSGNKALYLVSQGVLLCLPKFADKALGYISALHSNTTPTYNKSFNLCTNVGDMGAADPVDPTSAKQIKTVYFDATQRGGVDQSAYYWTVNTDNLVKGRQWYIQPRTGSSNICLRRLELYYYKQD